MREATGPIHSQPEISEQEVGLTHVDEAQALGGAHVHDYAGET